MTTKSQIRHWDTTYIASVCANELNAQRSYRNSQPLKLGVLRTLHSIIIWQVYALASCLRDEYANLLVLLLEWKDCTNAALSRHQAISA